MHVFSEARGDALGLHFGFALSLATAGASRAEALANLKSRYGARLDRNE